MVQQLQVSFAGVHTFARAAQGTLANVQMGQTVVFGVPLEGTSNPRVGARMGPQGVRESSVDFVYGLQSASSLVDVPTGRTLNWPKNLNVVDLGDLALFPGAPDKTDEGIRDTMSALVSEGTFPIVIGGDHYVTYPLFQGFSQALKKQGKKVGLIQIARSLALAEDHPQWGQRWPGAALRQIMQDKLVESRNLVWLGTHGFLPQSEWEFANKTDATLLTLRTVRDKGIARAAEEALELAGDGTDSIYVSLDIGVVDPAYAPGRSELGYGGLLPEELLRLMELLSQPNVDALEVVEVAPPLDTTGRTPRLAAESIVEFIASRVFT